MGRKGLTTDQVQRFKSSFGPMEFWKKLRYLELMEGIVREEQLERSRNKYRSRDLRGNPVKQR